MVHSLGSANGAAGQALDPGPAGWRLAQNGRGDRESVPEHLAGDREIPIPLNTLYDSYALVRYIRGDWEIPIRIAYQSLLPVNVIVTPQR